MDNSSNRPFDFQRLAKQSEELRRQLEEISKAPMFVEAQRTIDMLRGTALEQQRVINAGIDALINSSEVAKARRAIDAISRTPRLVAQASRAMRQMHQFAETLSRRSAINVAALEIKESAYAQFRLAVEAHRPAIALVLARQAELTSAYASFKTAMAVPDRFNHSLLGFARLSRLSDAVHTGKPYSRPVSNLVTEELGSGIEAQPGDSASERDAAAVRAGLNPDLIAFQPSSYGDIVVAAGFEFRFRPMSAPQAAESPDSSAAFNPEYYRVVTEIESRLRDLIEETLTKLEGPGWIKRRVSKAVRDRWKERQEEERNAGRSVYAPIQYADFMDLGDIVRQSNNWEEGFQQIFGNREDFMVSLRRLHPVRKAIAHSRPLSRADVLTLVSEATRIFGALGIRILN